ncbi:MAG: hypothetical protein JWO94_1969 [Verrucomicrobiaceae bacterium]|nr:hypothetical protein [Verrucomicrobiaceae bacterium]
MSLSRFPSQSRPGIGFLLCLLALSLGLGVGLPIAATAQSGSQDNGYSQAADDALNTTYREVQQRFDATDRARLRNVERAWIAFNERDQAIFARVATDGADPSRAETYFTETYSRRERELLDLGSEDDVVRWYSREPPSLNEADAMLNQSYQLCIGLLSRDAAAAFKETQRLWLQFRDEHCHFDTQLRNGRSNPAVLCSLTLSRAMQFRHYVVVLVGRQLPPAQGDDINFQRNEPQTDLDSPPDIFRFVR